MAAILARQWFVSAKAWDFSYKKRGRTAECTASFFAFYSVGIEP